MVTPLLVFFLNFFVVVSEPPPVVQWLNETTYDFGVMEQGVPKSFSFEFRNISPEPIVLETVRTTCGCTAAEWPEAPIEPGATGAVSIEYDAYRSGAFKKKITVFFDRQKKAEVLWIKGTVR